MGRTRTPINADIAASTSRKTVLAVIHAARILELYGSAEKPWDAIVEEFGAPTNPETGRKMNLHEARIWAMRCFLGDQERMAIASRVAAELAKIAFSNIADLMPVTPITGEREEAFDIRNASREVMATVRKIKIKDEGIEVEMHDKVAALEKLGRATGLFNITDPDAAAPPLMGGDVGKTVTFFIPDNGTGPKMIDVTPSKPGK